MKIKTLVEIGLVLVLIIVCLFRVFYLPERDKEQLQIIQAPEHHIVLINKIETVMSVYQDGTREFAVQYEYCRDVATITGKRERCDREIIRISQ